MELFTAECIIREYEDKLIPPHAFMRTKDFEALSYQKFAIDETMQYVTNEYKKIKKDPIDALFEIKNIFNEYASRKDLEGYCIAENVVDDILDICYAAEEYPYNE